MFFNSWYPFGRIALVGLSAYAALVVLLRVYGKRTLTQMNAFDLVVNVALGSILATTLLNKDVVWAEGVFALLLLISLQWALTWVSARSTTIRGLIASSPTLVLHDGNLLQDVMRRHRLSNNDVMHALRNAGLSHAEQARAVVLETDGRFSVIKREGRHLCEGPVLHNS